MGSLLVDYIDHFKLKVSQVVCANIARFSFCPAKYGSLNYYKIQHLIEVTEMKSLLQFLEM